MLKTESAWYYMQLNKGFLFPEKEYRAIGENIKTSGLFFKSVCGNFFIFNEIPVLISVHM